MNIYINEKQKKLLLETLAIAHQVEYLKGNDNSELEELIAAFAHSLRKEGNEEIFHSVFREYRK
jgi:hypothetical protein